MSLKYLRSINYLMETFCPRVGKPVQAPARWWARMRKPLVSMAMGLGIAGTVTCTAPQETGQSLERDVGQLRPVPTVKADTQKQASCGARLNSVATVTLPSKREIRFLMRDKEAVKNLRRALDYWQKKDKEGTPRLLAEIKKFLAQKGVALESGMETEMRSRIENLRVGKNVFPFPGFFISMIGGMYAEGMVVVSSQDFSNPAFASAKGRKEPMATLAHEIMHSLANLPEKLANFPEECWTPMATIVEGVTEYISSGITAGPFGRGIRAYPEEKCIIARLAEDKNVLGAVIKVFFMPPGERQARKRELNESF